MGAVPVDTEPVKEIVRQLRDTVVEWQRANAELSRQDRMEVDLRSLVALLPYVGGAIDQKYWGTKDKRWQRVVEETLERVATELHVTRDDVAKLTHYYESSEFASLFEAAWLRIRQASERQQLRALQGALVSIISATPQLEHDKRVFFLRAVERMGDVHIQLLQLLDSQRRGAPEEAGQEVRALFQVLGVEGEANQELVYSAFDVLAGFRLIVHENIPQRGSEGPIEYLRQRFHATALGSEFLEFVRAPTAVESPTEPARRS